MIRIGSNDFPFDTLIRKNDKYFLILSKKNEKVLKEMENGKSVVINGGEDENIFSSILDNAEIENPAKYLPESMKFDCNLPFEEKILFVAYKNLSIICH
jgi:hypothetical protein